MCKSSGFLEEIHFTWKGSTLEQEGGGFDDDIGHVIYDVLG